MEIAPHAFLQGCRDSSKHAVVASIWGKNLPPVQDRKRKTAKQQRLMVRVTWMSIVPALQAEEKGKEVAALAAEQDLWNFCHVLWCEIIQK